MSARPDIKGRSFFGCPAGNPRKEAAILSMEILVQWLTCAPWTSCLLRGPCTCNLAMSGLALAPGRLGKSFPPCSRLCWYSLHSPPPGRALRDNPPHPYVPSPTLTKKPGQPIEQVLRQPPTTTSKLRKPSLRPLYG